MVALNDLETASLVTSMVTVYCGIFFISDMSLLNLDENKDNEAL